jgi:hypothetical protein
VFPHLLASVVQQSYAPGLATALIGNLPVCGYLIYRALHDRRLERARYLRAVVLGVPAIAASIRPLLALGAWLERQLR